MLVSRTKEKLEELKDEIEGEGRGAIRPGGQKYIFIYPFWKTRPWYLLPATERKRLMDEQSMEAVR